MIIVEMVDVFFLFFFFFFSYCFFYDPLRGSAAGIDVSDDAQKEKESVSLETIGATSVKRRVSESWSSGVIQIRRGAASYRV